MDATPDDERHPDTGETSEHAVASEHTETTVEAAVRAKFGSLLGGPRGGVETALPIAAFTVVYLVTDEVRPAAALSVGAALALWGLRRARRSSTKFVRQGLFGMVVAAVIALATGRAETAFLPGIIQAAVWAVVLVGSVLVRRPVAGYVIGAVLGDLTGWRTDPAIVRLGTRLTLVLAAPMLVRVAVQSPLFLAGEVGWLGATRIALGWPLHVATLAVVAAMLARGHTPVRGSVPPPA